jgi:hypothetical protein
MPSFQRRIPIPEESAKDGRMSSEQQHGHDLQEPAAGLHEDPRDPAGSILRDISRAMVRI